MRYFTGQVIEERPVSYSKAFLRSKITPVPVLAYSNGNSASIMIEASEAVSLKMAVYPRPGRLNQLQKNITPNNRVVEVRKAREIGSSSSFLATGTLALPYT